MTILYRRYRCEGEAHRARLRALLLPRLYVGAMLPRQTCVGRWLGISASEGGRHLRRVLDEEGIARRVCGSPRRVVVVAVAEREIAA